MTTMSRYKIDANFIGGEWKRSGDKSITVTNPATGEILGTVPSFGATETREAISAAYKTFPVYAAMPLGERIALMRKLHDALLDNRSELAALLTAEQGKPLAEAAGEISIGAAYILWFAEEIRRAKGEIIPAATPGRRMMVTHHPVGVVGAITPWNFPSSMLARKLGPALAVGCTTVVKPASQTPYSALAWGKLAEEVGFPAGTINIVTGPPREIAETLMADKRVRKITFTGSTNVGKILIRQSADTVKKVSMELGGNAPFIVFDDADLNQAIEGALVAKYRNSGQTCVCANRFYVQSGIYDAFVKKLTQKTQNLIVGDGTGAGVDQGPLIDESAFKKVSALVDDAKVKGATINTGGHPHHLGRTWYEPTVISNVTTTMRIATEEIFGPVAAIMRFENEDDVIEAANDTDFGLAAYVYTNNMVRVFRMNDRLQYGMIGINEGLITTVETPFGGIKESGLGKEGGSQGLSDYLDTKYICIGGI
jgi:succinate-semialdehyde dehydrogenase/glutarate-semialdehyde dehydrogenase